MLWHSTRAHAPSKYKYTSHSAHPIVSVSSIFVKLLMLRCCVWFGYQLLIYANTVFIHFDLFDVCFASCVVIRCVLPPLFIPIAAPYLLSPSFFVSIHFIFLSFVCVRCMCVCASDYCLYLNMIQLEWVGGELSERGYISMEILLTLVI